MLLDEGEQSETRNLAEGGTKMASGKSGSSWMDSLSSFFLPIATPYRHWPAMHQADAFLERQQRMERQNMIIIDLLQQIRDRL